jgi:hypothetical protein
MLSWPPINLFRGSKKKDRESKMNERKQKSTKSRQSTLRLPTLTAILILFGLMTIARPAAAACSNASLTGTYGIAWGWQQELYNAPNDQAYVVGQLTADGKGNLTGSETVSLDGSVSTVSVTGTYTVAANCTGTISLSPDFFNIYLDGSSTGFQMTITTPGFEAIGSGIPQVSATCGLTGKAQRLGINVSGTIPGSSVNKAIVGEIQLDGKGGVTGLVSINTNFSNSVVTATGAYTEASDCAGTLQLTPKGSSALNFNTVFVNGEKELLLIETDSGTVIGGTAE